ncbi:uncharacterized protein ACBT44_013877 [Syngnathus typhle]
MAGQKRPARRLLPSFPPVENGLGEKLSRGVQTVPRCTITLWSTPDNSGTEPNQGDTAFIASPQRNVPAEGSRSALSSAAAESPPAATAWSAPEGFDILPMPTPKPSVTTSQTAEGVSDLLSLMLQLPSLCYDDQRFNCFSRASSSTFEVFESPATLLATPGYGGESRLANGMEQHEHWSSSPAIDLFDDACALYPENGMDLPRLSVTDIAHMLNPEPEVMVTGDFVGYMDLAAGAGADDTIVEGYPSPTAGGNIPMQDYPLIDMDFELIPPLTSTPARVDAEQDEYAMKRPQVVRVGDKISASITLSTGAPQGCVLSPLLFTLLTHDCTATYSDNRIVKFADDTTLVGLITEGDETQYRLEVDLLTTWCRDNNLLLNVNKTKEIVVDFRMGHTQHLPLTIDGAVVERVSSTRFLGVHISEDLSRSTNTVSLAKKAQRRLYFLRKLRRASAPPAVMTTFYRGTIESVLSNCIDVWGGSCTEYNRKTLQRLVNTAGKIVGASLPSLKDIYTSHLTFKATTIVSDVSHPAHSLFDLLPSGKRYRSLRSRTTRLTNSFILQAVRILNSLPPSA